MSNWKADISPLTLAAVEWLEARYPFEDFCQPGWVLGSMIGSEYPGGMEAFVTQFEATKLAGKTIQSVQSTKDGYWMTVDGVTLPMPAHMLKAVTIKFGNKVVVLAHRYTGTKCPETSSQKT